METGLKRLWRRKKSKDVGEISRTGSSTNYVRYDSTTSDGRHSSATSRPLNKLNGSDYLSITSGEYPKTKSGNRIQPILIGISRPGDFTHRPETAVSLNTAVQRAADTARTSQERSRNQSTSARSHQHTASGRSGRSLDIFRVAGKLAGYKSRFNEEIAERNIEVIQAAQDPQPGYDLRNRPAYIPTSRYQEEVADRNASGLFGTKTSVEYERATSLTSNITRPNRSPATSPNYQPSRNESQSGSRSSFEQPAYHPRQYTLKSREGNQPLSVILQEQLNEEDSLHEEHNWPSQATMKANTSKTLDHPISLTTKPLPDLPPAELERPISVRNVTPAARRISSSHSQAESLSIPHPPARHPGRVGVDMHGVNDIKSSPHKVVNRSARSSSLLSSTSMKGTSTVPERKIMDLTGEDVYSETSSTYGYSQYSPILEHANTSRFERTSRPGQRPTSSRYIPSDVESIPELSQSTAQTSTIPPIPVQENLAEVSTANVQRKPTEQGISFSAISTVASLPPRSANRISEKPPATAQTRRAVEESSTASVTQNGTSSILENQSEIKTRRGPLREESMSRVQRTAAAFEARSASQSPSRVQGANGDAAKRRSFVAGQDSSALSMDKTSAADSRATKREPDVSSKDLPAVIRDDNRPPEASDHTPQRTPAAKVNATAQTPSIYDSPDSLHSADYTNPGSSFGIRTRDFAVTPIKPAKPQAKKSDTQLLQRTATENAYKAGNEARSGGAKSEQKGPIKSATKKTTKSPAKRSVSAAYVTSTSEFDEEAFARKQAEAKAALLRLQQSLQEDFITMPVPMPPKHRTQSVEEDGSPVAPSSIVYPQSILNQSIERPVFSRSRTQEIVKPPTRPRGAMTSTDRAPSASSMYSRPGGGPSASARKTAPPSLKNVEPASAPINYATLPPSLQQLLHNSSQLPRSPGEISLSSFPIPSSRPGSEHDNSINLSRPTGYAHMRRNSNRSQTSVASQFSIPFHMIPDRSSSYRDVLMEEED